MTQETKSHVRYILEVLGNKKIRHEVHEFTSGAVIVNLWLRGKIFVIQLDGEFFGLSKLEMGDNEFNSVPDKVYENYDAFRTAFDRLFTE